jgi:rod shape-determining protein MreC
MFQGLFGRYRDRTLLVFTLLLSGGLLCLDDGTQTDVARGLGSSLYLPLQAVSQGTGDLLLLKRENRQLRRVVATLALERQKLLQYRDEVAELRRVAGFAAERFPWLMPCELVGRSPDHLQTTLQLACGGGESVLPGMAVVAYAGLVGRVRQVNGEHALVETLASSQTAASVTDQRSGVVGILRWVQGKQFRLDRVDAVEDVLVGDPLVTSGLGEAFPRGIPVGVVTGVQVSLDGLFKQVDVRPHVDFAGLKEVFVVRRMVDWQDNTLYSPEETDTLHRLSAPAAAPQPQGGGE